MVWFPEAFVKSKAEHRTDMISASVSLLFGFVPALQPRGQPEVH